MSSKKNPKNNLIFLLCCFLLLAFGLLALFFYSKNQPRDYTKAPPGYAEMSQDLLQDFSITGDEHIFGDLNKASVVVVEYSDTECPYCKLFHGKFKEEILSAHSQEVAWVYRHFPLDIHPRAVKEAEALECAAEQGGTDMFWQYLELIFAVTPSNNDLDPAVLTSLAKKLGLSVSEFTSCLTENRYLEKVVNEKAEGAKLGISQTPSVIVWNRATEEKVLISGANSKFYRVKALVFAALGKKPPAPHEIPESPDENCSTLGYCEPQTTP